MAVVIASNLRKELAGSLLFDGVSFKVERRERVALGGPNGAGKTTLLRMLAGQTEIHGGELAFAKGTRIALHDQRPPLQRGITLREYILSGAADLVAIEGELRRLEEAMASGDHGEQTLRRYAEAQARLEHAGGYAWRERVGSVARGLGFADADLDRVLDTFSGGELTRASLARSLGGDPDLLLLDEPTNHLDVASLEWLETELSSLDAGVILVAHDRWFLEATTTAVLELDAGRSTFFSGPWSAWRIEKAARLQAATKEAARYAEDIARLERFVSRFRYKKSKAKQAQAKLTQIGRLSQEKSELGEEISLLTRRSRRLGFGFIDPPRSGRTVLEVDDLDMSIGGRELLHDATFALERGEHVALVGPNGTGKTTLIRDDRRRARGGRRPRAHRALGQGRVLLAAGGRARRAAHGAAVDAARDRAAASAGAGAARPLPVLRLGRAREVGVGALRGRAPPARARARRRVGRELPRARRADEPPRPRVARGARSRAGVVPRDGAAHLPRPRADRRRRRADARDRGRHDQRLRRRLGRLRAPARGERRKT